MPELNDVIETTKNVDSSDTNINESTTQHVEVVVSKKKKAPTTDTVKATRIKNHSENVENSDTNPKHTKKSHSENQKTSEVSHSNTETISNESDTNVTNGKKKSIFTKAKPTTKQSTTKPEPSNISESDAIEAQPVLEHIESETIPKEPKVKKIKVISQSELDSKLIRPPMEQITKDFEDYVLSQNFGKKDIEKLPFKCGKVIFGLHNEDKKDIRLIAYKARGKSKSVSGKSRCIYYFGIIDPSDENIVSITKTIPCAKVMNVGQGTIQSKKPIELILDRTTYFNDFNKDPDKVMNVLKTLVNITLNQRSNVESETESET